MTCLFSHDWEYIQVYGEKVASGRVKIFNDPGRITYVERCKRCNKDRTLIEVYGYLAVAEFKYYE